HAIEMAYGYQGLTPSDVKSWETELRGALRRDEPDTGIATLLDEARLGTIVSYSPLDQSLLPADSESQEIVGGNIHLYQFTAPPACDIEIVDADLPCILQWRNANQFEIALPDTHGVGQVLVRERYHPGWTARIDGIAAIPQRAGAHGLQMTLAIPA